ncbi:MAG: sigma-70 family RNA polymerase sigma factor [Thermoleophilaceae bacterium]
MLHHSEDRRLVRLVRRARGGDRRAREALARDLMPVAERVAHRFASSHHPAEDLIQVASIGLLKALDRFDPSRENTFTTYAHALMTGEVRRHLRDARLVRVPRPIYDQVPRFQRELDRLSAQLHRAPSRQELADALGVSKEELVEIADAAVAAQTVSLDASIDGTGADVELAEHDDGYERVEAGASLAPMLAGLSARERMILDLRFGDGLSQSEIAAGLGLSQTQISRILRRALAKLSAHAPGVAA